MLKHILLLLCILSLPVAADSDTQLREIDKSIRYREYRHAISQLKPLLLQNNAQAQYRMAGLYRTGKGVEANIEKAILLYKKSALNGLAEAQYVLASLLEKQGYQSSSEESLKWYRAAADQGHRKSVQKLAKLDQAPTADSSIEHDAIFSAIRNNDIRLVNSFIDRGVNLDIQDGAGRSALMIALSAGQRDMSALLLARSTRLDQPDKDLNRPLHIASRNGFSDIVQTLIDGNVDIDAQDGLGNTALILATRHANTGLIDLLLTHRADPRILNRKGQSATDIAQNQQDAEVIRRFKRHGISPYKQSKNDASVDLELFRKNIKNSSSLYKNWPLINIASLLGETGIVTQLLQQGADIDALDPMGNTALHRSAAKGNIDTLKLLLSRGSDINALNGRNETPLYLAAAAGRVKTTGLLVKKGANTMLLTENQHSALAIAIGNQHAGTALTLVDARLDDASIHQALLLAIQRRIEDIAIRLIDRDTLLNKPDNKNRSLLWHSADQGLIKTTSELLLRKRMDIDLTDSNGYSALARAVSNGDNPIASLLIERGASLDTLTRENNSILMLAVQSGQLALIKKIIQMKAELNTKNRSGDNALMLAAAAGDNATVELLIRSGADIQTRNQDDLNAYQIALNSGHPETAELIRKHSGRLFKLFN